MDGVGTRNTRLKRRQKKMRTEGNTLHLGRMYTYAEYVCFEGTCSSSRTANIGDAVVVLYYIREREDLSVLV